MSASPTMKSLKCFTLKGLNHERVGTRCPTGALPLPTLTSAHTDITVNIVSSIPSSAFWKLAETSIPT